MTWRWLKKSGLQDGSGTIDVNGHTVRIVVQDLVTTKHRVAIVNGSEIARAGKFTVLIRKLEGILTP